MDSKPSTTEACYEICGPVGVCLYALVLLAFLAFYVFLAVINIWVWVDVQFIREAIETITLTCQAT